MNQTTPASLRRLFLLAGVLPALTAFAQSDAPEQLPDYVLTATRTPAALTTTGTVVDLISAADLARMQLTSLQSALGGVPGAPVLASGAAGGVASLFLRGSNSNQTLFLVDGIRFNDPNTDYAVALGGMSFTAGDTLEIARGPQSTLYGGEAVGGVLSLRSQRGAGAATQAVSFEAGSFGTLQATLAAQGGEAQSAYRFSVNAGSTQNDRPNNDFTSLNYALRLDRQVSREVAVGATVRGFFSDYGSPGDIYTNNLVEQDRERNELATVFATYAPTVNFSSKVVLGGQDRRFQSNDPGAFGTGLTTVTNRRAVLDWQNTLQAGEHHRVTAGLTAEENHTVNDGFGAINRRQKLLAVFAQDEWTPADHVYLTGGLRNDDFDTFGRATTGRATAAWLSPTSRWKLRATGGTAFRSPSLLDLYGQSSYYVGNPHLRPEKARGWDAGVDWFFAGNRGLVSATWFETRFSDLIVYDFSVYPGTTANVQNAVTRGLELSAKFNLPGAVEARVAYTYLQADDLTDGTRLLRRPRQSGSADLWRDLGRGFSTGAGVAFRTDTQDVDAATYATIKGQDYAVARIYGAWAVNKHLTIKLRVENLLNKSYAQVNGYPQLGRGEYAGMDWKF